MNQFPRLGSQRAPCPVVGNNGDGLAGPLPRRGHSLPLLGSREWFRSGDERKDMVKLLDCAFDIMELWKTENSPYNTELRAQWMTRARELGAEPSW